MMALLSVMKFGLGDDVTSFYGDTDDNVVGSI
jgi:hypothetical protein